MWNRVIVWRGDFVRLLTGHGRIEWSRAGVEGHAYAEVPVRAPTIRDLLAGDVE